jgi:pimeloyl-ACP methyl ester carboxylesterase
MPKVSSNGIEIAYEEHGSTGDPVLLMVQGLGMPPAAWPGVLIEALVAERFRVVTFHRIN